MPLPKERFDEIVCELYERFANDPVSEWGEAQLDFVKRPKNEIYYYHSTLGRSIRNEFKLWEYMWEPEIIGGVDHSPDHPDQVSDRIMTALWEKLRVVYAISANT